jgi:hypothetical protein
LDALARSLEGLLKSPVTVQHRTDVGQRTGEFRKKGVRASRRELATDLNGFVAGLERSLAPTEVPERSSQVAERIG